MQIKVGGNAHVYASARDLAALESKIHNFMHASVQNFVGHSSFLRGKGAWAGSPSTIKNSLFLTQPMRTSSPSKVNVIEKKPAFASDAAAIGDASAAAYDLQKFVAGLGSLSSRLCQDFTKMKAVLALVCSTGVSALSMSQKALAANRLLGVPTVQKDPVEKLNEVREYLQKDCGDSCVQYWDSLLASAQKSGKSVIETLSMAGNDVLEKVQEYKKACEHEDPSSALAAFKTEHSSFLTTTQTSMTPFLDTPCFDEKSCKIVEVLGNRCNYARVLRPVSHTGWSLELGACNSSGPVISHSGRVYLRNSFRCAPDGHVRRSALLMFQGSSRGSAPFAWFRISGSRMVSLQLAPRTGQDEFEVNIAVVEIATQQWGVHKLFCGGGRASSFHGRRGNTMLVECSREGVAWLEKLMSGLSQLRVIFNDASRIEPPDIGKELGRVMDSAAAASTRAPYSPPPPYAEIDGAGPLWLLPGGRLVVQDDAGVWKEAVIDNVKDVLWKIEEVATPGTRPSAAAGLSWSDAAAGNPVVAAHASSSRGRAGPAPSADRGPVDSGFASALRADPAELQADAHEPTFTCLVAVWNCNGTGNLPALARRISQSRRKPLFLLLAETHKELVEDEDFGERFSVDGTGCEYICLAHTSRFKARQQRTSGQVRIYGRADAFGTFRADQLFDYRSKLSRSACIRFFRDGDVLQPARPIDFLADVSAARAGPCLLIQTYMVQNARNDHGDSGLRAAEEQLQEWMDAVQVLANGTKLIIVGGDFNCCFDDLQGQRRRGRLASVRSVYDLRCRLVRFLFGLAPFAAKSGTTFRRGILRSRIDFFLSSVPEVEIHTVFPERDRLQQEHAVLEGSVCTSFDAGLLSGAISDEPDAAAQHEPPTLDLGGYEDVQLTPGIFNKVQIMKDGFRPWPRGFSALVMPGAKSDQQKLSKLIESALKGFVASGQGFADVKWRELNAIFATALLALVHKPDGVEDGAARAQRLEGAGLVRLRRPIKSAQAGAFRELEPRALAAAARAAPQARITAYAAARQKFAGAKRGEPCGVLRDFKFAGLSVVGNPAKVAQCQLANNLLLPPAFKSSLGILASGSPQPGCVNRFLDWAVRCLRVLPPPPFSCKDLLRWIAKASPTVQGPGGIRFAVWASWIKCFPQLSHDLIRGMFKDLAGWERRDIQGFFGEWTAVCANLLWKQAPKKVRLVVSADGSTLVPMVVAFKLILRDLLVHDLLGSWATNCIPGVSCLTGCYAWSLRHKDRVALQVKRSREGLLAGLVLPAVIFRQLRHCLLMAVDPDGVLYADGVERACACMARFCSDFNCDSGEIPGWDAPEYYKDPGAVLNALWADVVDTSGVTGSAGCAADVFLTVDDML
eukprot:g20398.t1